MTDQPTPPPVQWAPPPVAPQKRSVLPWLIPVTAVGGILLGIGGTLAFQALPASSTAITKDTRLADAVYECRTSVWMDVSDDDQSLTIEMKGDEDTVGADIDDLACVLTELETPDFVISHISQTTAMDGRQTESWDGLTAAWSYHPDRGSDMIIRVDGE